MNIKIQTLDNIYPIAVGKEITIEELKQKIQEVKIKP
jgi:hypothetical protein